MEYEELGPGTTRPLPLEGVTVLDLGQIYNGPYAGFLLATAGARVIKVEPPTGENMRRRTSVSQGAMLPFAMLNSYKEFLSLNLKSEAGKKVFLNLVSKADIVIENFAPGVMDRLGVGPDVLLGVNPRLVYGAGSGYGTTGPYKDYLAMDLTVQAMSGVMATTGFPDRAPVKAGPALCDFFGGVHLYGAIVTALVEAMRTGRGRVVEVAMLEAVYPALSSSLGLYQTLGENPPRTGNRHGGMSEAPYNVYPALDGWVALFCVNQGHFEGLANAIERPDLLIDPRFADLNARVEHIDEIDNIISQWTKIYPKAAVVEVLATHRVPCSPVRELDEVVNDPHMHERGALRRVNHPDFGEIVLPTGAMRFGDQRDLTLSKEIGADTAKILQDLLDVDDERLRQLFKQGAI